LIAGEEEIIVARLRHAAGQESRFYVHEVFSSKEIKEEQHLHTPGTPAKTGQLRSTALYKSILKDLYDVK
jgi:hypothetical protein